MNRFKCSGRALRLASIALFTLAGSAIPGWAVTPIASCPFFISAPGNFVVTADLNCSTDAIDITASGVSVNLNGHIITGNSTTIGIDVIAPAGPITQNHVTIEGPGLIQKFAVGIRLIGCDYCQVALATSAHNAVGILVLGHYATLGSNAAVANSSIGIDLAACDNCQIQSNDASGNGGFGIIVDGGFGSTVNNNSANGNTGSGIATGTFASATRIYSNVTNGNSQAGISVAANAAGIQVFNNSSSVGNGAFDMQDGNLSCGTDLWNNNVFFTRNQACIH